MKRKTNFDRYLEEQLKDQGFAERFKKAGKERDVALEPATLRKGSGLSQKDEMNSNDLLSRIALGEDSTRQFKANAKNGDALASEMAAFANSEGGTIFIGVGNDGSTPGLTREDVARINQLISNSILVSFVAKGLLPYHGLGSGIKRALEKWPDIDFTDDRDRCLFTATVHRKAVAGEAAVVLPKMLVKSSGETSGKSSPKSSGKSSGKTEDQILGLLSEKPRMTIPELAEALRITKPGCGKADYEATPRRTPPPRRFG